METEALNHAGKLKDLIGTTQHKPLVYANRETSLNEACAILKKNNISSLPIFDSAKKEYVGLVDMTDICLLVVYGYAQKSKEHAGEIYQEDLFKSVKVVDLLPIADEGKLAWSFPPDRDVEDTMEAFSKGVHRAIVQLGEGDYHILSQRDAIKFLLDSHMYDSVFNKRLSELPQLFEFQPPLVSIDGNAPAIDGFKKIGREHFGAVPVVDEKGKVFASLCATDLSGTDPTLLHALLLPTHIFLKIVHENKIPQPITASGDDTLGDIVQKIMDASDHRAWMLDGQGNLSGVITLSDICRVFVKY
jgi:CBS domain-containing protein